MSMLACGLFRNTDSQTISTQVPDHTHILLDLNEIQPLGWNLLSFNVHLIYLLIIKIDNVKMSMYRKH